MTRRDLLAGLGVASLGAGQAAAWGDDATAVFAAPPIVERLDNGATLVTLPEPKANGVVWDVFFRVGLQDEGGRQGIRSLIARSWIGQTQWRSAVLLNQDLERAGASAGTNCGADWVEVWGASGAGEDQVQEAVRTLFTNVIAGVQFGQEAVEAAKAEQLRALLLRRDDLILQTVDRAQARVFGDSPYGLNPLGTDESVAATPWKEVGEFYRRWFRPERVVIVAAGRITPTDARRWVLAGLGAAAWDEAAPPAPRDRPIPTVAPAPLREQRLSRRAPATCVALAYLAPGIDGSSGRTDYAALRVLDAVLRGGKASRLFTLRDRPDAGASALGYEIRTAFIPGRWQSFWAAYVAGDQPAATVRDGLRTVLDALASGKTPLTDEEVVRAQTYLKARHREARQRLKERAFGVGWAETLGLGAAFDADFDVRIEVVNAADVARVAQTVLGAAPVVVWSGGG